MRIIPIAGFLLLLNWQASAQEPQATDSAKPSNSAKCIVAGSVARQDAGAPLKKATVVLRSNETFERSVFTITDDQGHFEFDNVEPGSYRLDAWHDGYLDSQYGQKKPGDPGANLSLVAGQKMTDLVFKLLRPASITGHVIDEDGEPLSNVSVKAYQASNRRGKSAMGTAASVETNDLGEYRIFDLRPGRYYIRASYSYRWRGNLTGITPSSPQISKEDYPPTFYPNTTDPTKADTITTKAGDEIPAVDFILKPSRVVTVTGKIFNAVTTQPNSNVVVSLVPRGTILVADDASLEGETGNRKGSFVVRDVFPGSYILQAWWSSNQEQISARRVLDVGDSDVEGANLTITRGVDVPGRLVWEEKPPGEVQVAHVALRALDEGFCNSGAHEVKPDGSFVIKNVLEGVYRPLVFTGTQDCFIKSARYGSTDVADGSLAVHPGVDVSLELKMSCRAAQIEGVALTDDSLPAAGVYVVAIPDAPLRSQEWKYRAEITDQNGRFLLRGILPGQYRIFSWDSADDFDWYDAGQLKPYESRGVPIGVQESDHKTVQVTVMVTENAAQAKQ